MEPRFEVVLLREAEEFLASLDNASRRKILYNMEKASYINDPRLFKKLKNDIWEFRTNIHKKQFRFLAFWDKRSKQETLVIATHGMIKKQSKMPKAEIEKAEAISKRYFEQ